jgi:hypothetical protein
MTDFVYNPRRAPRALLGRSGRVQRASGVAFEGPIVDLGPTGCQVVTPAPLPPGERIVVSLADGAPAAAPTLRGHVVWTANAAPFRSGVQFDPSCQDDASLLYGRLAAERPDLVDVDALPERLPLSARVVPWAREADAAVLPGEEEVLLAVGAGARLGEVRERLGARWDVAINPFFALLARRLLVIEEEPKPP